MISLSLSLSLSNPIALCANRDGSKIHHYSFIIHPAS